MSPSQANGGSFVNSGTYGCVFNPPIQCYRKKTVAATMTDAAGKIFDDDEAFKEEYAELKKIHKLDPKNTFTVPYLGHCKVHKKDFKPSDEIDKCIQHISSPRTKYTQLIYKFGGIDLHEYYKNPTRHMFYLEDLVRLFVPVMTGIQSMVQKKIAHVDIKPENMLLDTAIPKVYLIDFGLSTPFSLMKDETNFHDHVYPYYPPEFKVLSLLRTGNYGVTAATHEFHTNFRYYNQKVFMKWLTAQWPTYPEALKHFFEKFRGRTLAEAQKEFDAHMVSTLDSYGLAMTLIEVIYRLTVSKQLTLKHPKSDFVKDLLRTVLFPMIHPDAYKRATIAEVLPDLTQLLATSDSIPPPPPPPPHPPTRAPAPPAKVPVASPPSPVLPPVSLTKCLYMKTKEIQVFLKQYKLPIYGNKAQLCKRLMDYIKAHPPYAPTAPAP